MINVFRYTHAALICIKSRSLWLTRGTQHRSLQVLSNCRMFVFNRATWQNLHQNNKQKNEKETWKIVQSLSLYCSLAPLRAHSMIMCPQTFKVFSCYGDISIKHAQEMKYILSFVVGSCSQQWRDCRVCFQRATFRTRSPGLYSCGVLPSLDYYTLISKS